MFSAMQRLFAPKADSQVQTLASEIHRARMARKAAVSEYHAAKEAGDTRRVHVATRAMKAATTRLVRLEIGS